MIAFHDFIPLDAVTSAPQRSKEFWSGDLWNLVLYQRQYRPDLGLVSVAIKPTGLGLVTGLDAENRILRDNHGQIVAEFLPLAYDDIASQENESLRVIANDVQLVKDCLHEHRLRAA